MHIAVMMMKHPPFTHFRIQHIHMYTATTACYRVTRMYIHVPQTVHIVTIEQYTLDPS